jgi:hypothetical protein
MSDEDLDTIDDAEAPAKGRKAVTSEAKDRELRVARAMVRAIWQAEWVAANPKATAAERTAAWKEGRADRMQAQLKTMRTAVRQLEKQGMTISMPEVAAEE